MVRKGELRIANCGFRIESPLLSYFELRIDNFELNRGIFFLILHFAFFIDGFVSVYS